MKSAWIITILKVSIAAGLLWWLFGSDRISLEDFRALDERWPWWVAAFGLYGLVLILAATRWRLLLDMQDLRYGWGEVCRLTLVGHFFNLFLPGSTGGDVAKAIYAASDHPERRGAAVLSVFFDRLLGLAVLVLVAAAVAVIQWPLVKSDPLLYSLAISAWVGTLFIAIGVLLVELRLPWPLGLRNLVARVPLSATVFETLAAYRKQRGRVVLAGIYSIGIHLLIATLHLTLFLALVRSPDRLESLYLVIPFAQIAMAIPLTPGSLGTAEAAYGELVRTIGSEVGSELCILFRTVLIAWAVLGGLCYLARRRPPRVREGERPESLTPESAGDSAARLDDAVAGPAQGAPGGMSSSTGC